MHSAAVFVCCIWLVLHMLSHNATGTFAGVNIPFVRHVMSHLQGCQNNYSNYPNIIPIRCPPKTIGAVQVCKRLRDNYVHAWGSFRGGDYNMRISVCNAKDLPHKFRIFTCTHSVYILSLV